jgi:RHH-type proline utilization regulon transcriptional repressor/proline dehydrogenase/delta 1-pyrroline-5-carboxylate dehydrogenase
MGRVETAPNPAGPVPLPDVRAGADAEALVEPAVALAAQWLRRARADERPPQARVVSRLQGVVDDPDGVAFTMRFVDRVARHRDDAAAADQLAALVRGTPLPAFLSPTDRGLLRAGAAVAPLVPRAVMPVARERMRRLVGHLVVDAEPRSLHAHLARERADGFGLNVNLLGELVLGEQEAARRFERTLSLVDDPQIDYVSIKVSAIASQLDLWSFDVTVARICQRLRELFARAATSQPPTFVNLDMEEYRDLELTLAAFTSVLDEPHLRGLDAGIVLQAYLPDAAGALDRLVGWAQRRHAAGGGRVKIRLVKGANLAMERVDAALHGWEQAPYPSKADVDASFKRCVDRALAAEPMEGVRVGLASHNLFDLAWAHLLAGARGVSERLEMEMLTGISPAQARAVLADTGSLRLYTPVVARRDFDIAIGYLFRRLEENTSPENFLRHLWTLEPDSPEFARQADRFRAAVAARTRVDVTPRRLRGLNALVARHDADAHGPLPDPDQFVNEPDTDPSLPDTQRWLAEVRRVLPSPVRAPLLTDPAGVDAALARARAAQPSWAARPAADRRAVLHRVAAGLAARRGELLATMAHEGRKVFAEADPEISEAIDFARWYGDRALELDDLTRTDGLLFAPWGVVGVVPPWNFPVAIPAGGVLAALAAGNAVLFKPSLETPRCAEVVAEACWEAGVPDDVLHLVRTPDDKVGRHLVTSVDAVVLTGSWETANLFLSWRPDLPLLAETSGKNALVITRQADVDLAATDLVRSAFGHAGQKCSAASLGILVGELADDERFLGKVLDAARSLRVGLPTEAGTTLGPVIVPAAGKLLDALTTLQPGERWLLEPRCLDESGALWTPGIKTGVQPGSPFHQVEYFGPVLGLMRAADLDEAIRLQNDVPYGLTGGIHSLDPAEVEQWLDAVQVGNAYVNRHITGAIVRRQPFGGWKRSSVGPGAKAGGPDYLLQLGRWEDAPDCDLDPVDSDRHWWDSWYGRDHDPTGLFCEQNLLRYRRRPDVLVRLAVDAKPDAAARTVAAAHRVGVHPLVSAATPQAAGALPAVLESDQTFLARLARHRFGRVRHVGTVPAALRTAASAAEVDVVDAPVVLSGRLELRWYLREQAVSRTLHRFGNVLEQAS